MSQAKSEPSDGNEWLMIGLDEKMARRQGLPQQIPVPKAEFEGMADKGLSIDKARKWVKDFLTTSPAGQDATWRRRNSGLVTTLDAFVDNAALWEKAQKAFAENDYEKAISVLKRITIMNAEDHAAKLNLASAYANVGDYESALKNFKAIRKTFEGDADFHVAVGHVYLRLQDKDNALNEMVLALEAKPDCEPALETLVQLGVLRAVYESPRDATSLIYVRADSVVAYLSEVWEKEPRDVAFYLEQLAYHERENRHDVALAAAEHAIAAAGEAGSERAELGAHRRAARARPHRRGARRRRGVRGEARRPGRAASLPKPPRSPGALVELAKSLAAVGRAEESRAAIDKRARDSIPATSPR